MSCVLGRGWKDGIAVMQSDFGIPSLETDSSEAEIVLEGLIFRHDSNFNSEDEDEYDELEESNLTSYDVEMSFLVTENLGESDEEGQTRLGSNGSGSNSNNSHNGSNGNPNTLENHQHQHHQHSNALVTHHESTRRLILRLAHDVTFITALPCFPSETESQSKSHPLHRSHTYTVHSLTSLPGLSAPPPAFPTAQEYSNRRNSDAGNNSSGGAAGRKANIFVIDASSSGQAGEVYAKVWCSDRGVPAALLAREGRGCLSCAIREAGAIGVGVVIWMGSWMV